MGLYNIVMKDPTFYEYAKEDVGITIDKSQKLIMLDNTKKVFPYTISTLEETLLDSGGVVSLYKKFDKALFRHLVSLGAGKNRTMKTNGANRQSGCGKSGPTLDW